jgi:DNA-binding SARP family transcriptional activator
VWTVVQHGRSAPSRRPAPVGRPGPEDVRFGILGPLSVDVGGRTLAVGPLKRQLVLAMLLCRPNAFVSSGLLTETLWQDEPPPAARKNLQAYVSALRKLLAEAGAGDRIGYRLGSYRLRVTEAELDALRFRALARSGREAAGAGDFEAATGMFEEALELWAGPPLPELGCSPLLREEADRLAGRHVGVCEDWAESALELGQAGHVAETLGELVEQHPLRERLRAAQMTALYRSGRQTEALTAYEELRQHLSRELGLPPSPAIEALYHAILTQRHVGTRRVASPDAPARPGAAPAGAAHSEPAPTEPALAESALTEPAHDNAAYAGRARTEAAPSGIAHAEATRPAPTHLGPAHPGPARAESPRAVAAHAPASASAPAQAFALLPPDSADFTGRTGQTAELFDMLARGGTVAVVTGPTGVGKTALAVRVAHRLSAEYPDGRICVRLRRDDGSARSPMSVVAELARWAVLTDRMPDDLGGATALWRSWLADRTVLLVLDGAPDEASVRPLLPPTGASSAVVTARTQLAGVTPAHRVEVPPYSPAEALELLARIIGLGRVRSDLAAAERIVAACGLLPLAVRAAGLKLAVLRHLPLGEYAARLADPAQVLDELAAGDTDVRSHAVGEWRQLDASGRAALLRLGSLPPLFTLDEAASALAEEPAVALRRLERLIGTGAIVPPASEVTAHAALYALPQLTRLYVGELALQHSPEPLDPAEPPNLPKPPNPAKSPAPQAG